METMTIKPGDRFVHRSDVDARVPAQGVRVSNLRDGNVEFSPEGGGFIYSIPLERFEADHMRREDAPAVEPKLSRFSFDEGPSWEGRDNGTRWNGWASPLVTPAVRDEIVAYLESLGGDMDPEDDPCVWLRALVPGDDGAIELNVGLCFSWDE